MYKAHATELRWKEITINQENKSNWLVQMHMCRRGWVTNRKFIVSGNTIEQIQEIDGAGKHARIGWWFNLDQLRRHWENRRPILTEVMAAFKRQPSSDLSWPQNLWCKKIIWKSFWLHTHTQNKADNDWRVRNIFSKSICWATLFATFRREGRVLRNRWMKRLCSHLIRWKESNLVRC